ARVRRDPSLVVRVEEREVQVVLAGEVRVDGALRVPGRLGDVVQRGAVEAAPHEDAPRGGDQLRARLRLALATADACRRHFDTVGINILSVFERQAPTW